MSLQGTVAVAPRYQRSVRLDTDLGSDSALDGIIASNSTLNVVNMLCQHRVEGKQGAFTWTGPYGCGKSTLAVAFGALFSADKGQRQAAAKTFGRETTNAVQSAFSLEERKWTVVTVVGARENPVQLIGNALVRCGVVEPRDVAWGEADLLEAIDGANRTTNLIIVVDEMGKCLEMSARGETDVHVFQQLAELASRRTDRLTFIGVLHQSFAEYGNRLSRERRDEWTKIAGRFVDLPVNIAAEEQIEMLNRALVCDNVSPDFEKLAVQTAEAIRERNPAISQTVGKSLSGVWPLHPVTALLLAAVSKRRFGQNQRSLFGFLNSAELGGFRDFLGKADDGELYSPALLWEYLADNLEASIMASPDGHRWAVAADAVARAEAAGVSALGVAVLKTVAMLDLFQDRAGAVASPDILKLVFQGNSASKMDDVLLELNSKALVVFREFKGAYAVFAGSDFDLEVALQEHLDAGQNLNLETLRVHAGLAPLLAKKHYHETGAMRWFDVEIATLSQIRDENWAPKASKASMGAFVLALSEGQEEFATLKSACEQRSDPSSSYSLVVGCSNTSDNVVRLARELSALEHIRSSHPQLAGDPVARREVQSRYYELASQLEEAVSVAFKDAGWYWNGNGPERLAGKSLNAFASELASANYPMAPLIDNELLNRSRPSANAVAAQNNLLKRLVTAPHEARFGIDGFPAEGGLYDSILIRAGLHIQKEEGWAIVPPDDGEDPCRLGAIWEAAETHLRSNSDRSVGINEIYELWSRPPYGVKRGLMPILATAFILSNQQSIASYRDGIFQSRFTDVDVEVMVRDASDVQLRWMSLSEREKSLLADLASVVSELSPNLTPRNYEPLDVARGIVSIVSELPKWSLRTMRLTRETLAVRNLLNKASDPNRLIFNDMPKLFGGGEKSSDSVASRLRSALMEISGVYPAEIDRIREIAMTELGVEGLDSVSIQKLRNRADNLQNVAGDFQVEALVARLRTFSGKPSDTEGMISLAISKPPDLWTDNDLDRAAVRIAELCQEFNRLEAFARVRGREDHRHAIAMVLGLGDVPKPVSIDFQLQTDELAGVERVSEALRSTLDNLNGADKRIVLAGLAAVSAEVASLLEDCEGKHDDG